MCTACERPPGYGSLMPSARCDPCRSSLDLGRLAGTNDRAAQRAWMLPRHRGRRLRGALARSGLVTGADGRTNRRLGGQGRAAPAGVLRGWRLEWPRTRGWEFAVAVVAVVSGVAAFWLTMRADFLAYPVWLAVQKADFILGPIGVGLYWRYRRPDNRMGLLLIGLWAAWDPLHPCLDFDAALQHRWDGRPLVRFGPEAHRIRVRAA